MATIIRSLGKMRAYQLSVISYNNARIAVNCEKLQVGNQTNNGAITSAWKAPEQCNVAVLCNLALYHFYDILPIFGVVVEEQCLLLPLHYLQ